MSFGIEGLHMCRALPIASKAVEGLPEFQAIWREEQKSEYDLMWRSRMQRPCSHKSLSNKRTTWSGKRKGEECRSGDGHFEWPPKIVGFIHSRNICQKEVITFSRLWKEEEALLIRREETMGANEDQALTIQRRSLKQWGIWRSKLLKNFLSTLAFG